MTISQRAFYQVHDAVVVHDAMAGKDHSVRAYTFAGDYDDQNMELPVY